jgi:hypothetical protein
MSLEFHAWTEFRAAGWCDENNKFKDEMQEAICKHILKLLKVFSDEGHSGTTALYTINLFSTLAKYEPIVPLTGEDWEWSNVSEFGGRDSGPLYQNKRCGHVFKDNTGAYDIQGIVWMEWFIDPETKKKTRSAFTSYESRVPVTFPYTPKIEYRDSITKELIET